MEEIKDQLEKALVELRQSKERKFDQTVDLIINLQNFNVKKTPLNFFVSVPNNIKEKKIAGFLESESKGVKTIKEGEFKKYSEKKSIKKLVKDFDFFIAQASLMPKVATNFGKVLGPAGKMPSPQLGIIPNVDEKAINDLKEKINRNIKIRVKEASIKLAVGKQKMENEKIIENILTIFNAIIKELPRGKENIKNLEIKFTMSKLIKIKIK